jgi:hypothetical protein
MVTVSPGCLVWTSWVSVAAPETGCPSKEVMVSPALRPASEAGLPPLTLWMTAPDPT